MDSNINRLYSDSRPMVGNPTTGGDPRTEFQRDFDRIIFSSAFRRLQNKTQVFPLPGSVFVHNRLTHSLEVASVGRSLGTLIGHSIYKHYKDDLTEESRSFYRYNLYNVIASACLCHDIGNPAFGHSGEDAIASFFSKNETELKKEFSEPEWEDLVNFEGNANAIRVLTQQQRGKLMNGLGLTYSTLASIAKYPCESIAKDTNYTHRKKFGFFQSEKEIFRDIAQNTHMIQLTDKPLIYARHPFVWLVEAADDICYTIVDLEDAHRLGLVEHSQCRELLESLLSELGIDDKTKISSQLDRLTDKNEQITYLRAKAINALTIGITEICEKQMDVFLNAEFQRPLFKQIGDHCLALKKIEVFSIQNIYNNRIVIEIENAGYNVMYELLSHFIYPILKDPDHRSKSDKLALKLLPPAFNYDGEGSYRKVLGILDYVSGMTDNYATDLYKRIKGIEIGMKI